MSYISEFTTDLHHIQCWMHSLEFYWMISPLPGLLLTTKQWRTPPKQMMKSCPSQSYHITLARWDSNQIWLPDIYDMCMGQACPIGPTWLQWLVFITLHNVSHPRVQATQKLIIVLLAWQGHHQDISKLVKCYFPFQQSKFHWHRVSPF